MNHVEEYYYHTENGDYLSAAWVALGNAMRKASRSGQYYWLEEVKKCLLLANIEYDKSLIERALKYRDYEGLYQWLYQKTKQSEDNDGKTNL